MLHRSLVSGAQQLFCWLQVRAQRANQAVRSWGKREWLVSAVLFPLAFISGTWWADSLRLRGHVLPGVVVLEQPLGGYSAGALAAWLSEQKTQFGKRPLRVLVGTQTFATTAAELGFSLDDEATQRAVLSEGRQGSLLRRVPARWRHAWGDAVPVAPVLNTDFGRLEALALAWQERALEEPAEGAVWLDGETFAARWPKPGSTLPLEQLAVEARAALLAGEDSLRAQTRAVEPRLSRAEVERALATAKGWTRRDLRLVHPSEPLRVLRFSSRTLKQALRSEITDDESARLQFSFDLEALQETLQEQRTQIEEPAVDAQFEIDFREQITILPSQAGTQIDETKLLASLVELAAGSSDTGELNLGPPALPKLSTEEAEAQGITKLVASFTTQHACCQPRVKNIQRIADLLDGVLLRAGEIFSVNDFVGPRTAANGFFPAPTIVEGEIEDTFGGGVSQFATTLFNAVLLGGYEIIERQPHSYYFKRYPLGHEATLSFPKPDLIFRNDTQHGLLLKTQYGGTFIRVKLYGDNEGRKVKLSRGQTYDITEPKTTFAVNDEFPPEKREVKERGDHGFKVEVSRLVTYASGESKEEKRKVTYNPRDRLIELHSCNVPEGEEGYTGKDCPEPECDPEREKCPISCASDDKVCLIQLSREWEPPEQTVDE